MFCVARVPTAPPDLCMPLIYRVVEYGIYIYKGRAKVNKDEVCAVPPALQAGQNSMESSSSRVLRTFPVSKLECIKGGRDEVCHPYVLPP